MPTSLTLDDMLGPSLEAKQLQLRQFELTDSLYDTLDALNEENAHTPGWTVQSAYKHPSFVQKRELLDANVKALEALLGPDAACSQVDSNLWSLYSDLYKDRMGFRPRGPQTRKEVLDWLDADMCAHDNGQPQTMP